MVRLAMSSASMVAVSVARREAVAFPGLLVTFISIEPGSGAGGLSTGIGI
jgi:hypothetical protein